MSNLTKVICLIGKSGSGKDTILRSILSKYPEYHKIVQYTTRPPRQHEINGKDYYFISPKDFESLLLDGDLIEANNFNNWFYGTGLSALDEDKINIGVFNPEAVEAILMHNDLDITVFCISAPEKIRIKRQLDREDYPDINEIFRRYKADEQDFYDLPFNYIVIENNKRADIPKAVKQIVSFSK